MNACPPGGKSEEKGEKEGLGQTKSHDVIPVLRKQWRPQLVVRLRGGEKKGVDKKKGETAPTSFWRESRLSQVVEANLLNVRTKTREGVWEGHRNN